MRIEILGDARGLRRAFSEADRASTGFAKGIAKAGVFAATGLAGIVAGVGVAAFKSIQAAQESNKVAKQTEAVLKSTGGAARVTAKQVSDLATAISNKTGIDDEQVQASENMLLTFTNIRNAAGKNNDIFTQATQITQDMSVALGQDGTKSAIQLGKALNDPVKGVTALQRVGVTFTASQKDQIKALVDSGRTMDAQKLILRELGKEFGGSAAAAATPLDRLKVIVGNVSEAVGNLLLPIVNKAADWLGSRLPGAVALLQSSLHLIAAGFREGDVTSSGFHGALERIGVGLRTAVFGVKALGSAFRGEGITSTGFVGVMERIGVVARSVFEDIRKIITVALLPAFKQLGTEGIGGLRSNITLLLSPLGLARAALRFAADHAEGLRQVLVILLPTIGAIKVALLAATLIQKGAALAMKGWAAATTVATVTAEVFRVVTGGVAQTVLGARIQLIALTIWEKAAAVATKAWSVATTVLGIAMKVALGPIGWIILAVTAVTAGIILLFKHNKAFHDFVIAAWKRIQGAFSAVWDWVKGHWPLLLGILTGPIGVAALLIVRNFGRIRDVAVTVFRVVTNAVLTWAGTTIHAAAAAFGWVPGLGGKLRGAAAAFDRFRDSTNRALRGIRDEQVAVAGKVSLTGPSQILKTFRAGPVVRMAAGGPVTQGSGPTADDVWARLSRGEFVLNAKATQAIGVRTLEQLNARRFADGGLVPRVGMDASPFRRGAASADRGFAKLGRAVGDALGKAANDFLSQALAAGGPGSAAMFAGFKGTIQQMAMAMLRTRGWGGQWASFNALEMGEAGWNVRARNPTSGAYGLAQALPPSKYPAAAFSANIMTAAAAQLGWMMDYIRGRYGDPNRAYGAWLSRSPHWYAKGGLVMDSGGWLVPGWNPPIYNGTGRPERVGGGEPVVVNQTIYAAPGMDERKVAELSLTLFRQEMSARDRRERKGPRA